MKENFNKVFDLFLDTSILSLRKYETDGVNIYEFDSEDLEKIFEGKIIDNIPSIYILENTNKNEYYVGETEKFLSRIKDHCRDEKKKFNKIYVINSTFLNKNICLELEAKTIDVFKNSIKNYKVENKNEINNSYLSSADKLRFKKIWKIFEEIYFLLKFNINPKKYNFDEDDDENLFFIIKMQKWKELKEAIYY